MTRLYVLYDPNCGLCTSVKGWLARQPAYVPLHPIAAGSPEAIKLFPGMPAERSGELAVISDNGEVYFGDHAWIMCLYALRDYRGMAKRLASPRLKPLAREAFAFISHHRHSISRWLKMVPEHEVRQMLQGVNVPRCVS